MKKAIFLDNRLKTVLAISATIIISLFLINIGKSIDRTPLANRQATVSNVEAFETFYIVKNHEGWVGIFEEGNNVPIRILDVRVTSLPENDIRELNNGILIKSKEELMLLIEDYSS